MVQVSLGLNVDQTDRCHSFCSHAIQNPEQLMQVEDAQLDQRFHENPLVTGSPDIRFYAGMPLLDKDGFALGSLCVIDQKPRLLTQVQQKALRTLAQQVIDKLSLLGLIKEKISMFSFFKSLKPSINYAVFLLFRSLRRTF